MNTGFPFHIPEDALERYALGRVPDEDCAPLDEHLLICPTCQAGLEEMDEYVKVMKAATATLSPATIEDSGHSQDRTDRILSR